MIRQMEKKWMAFYILTDRCRIGRNRYRGSRTARAVRSFGYLEALMVMLNVATNKMCSKNGRYPLKNGNFQKV